MKEKEEIKEGNKFSLLDGLVLLSGIFAAVVIVYTAYWYVDINEKNAEVAVSKMEEIYDCNYNEEQRLGHSVIKRMVVNDTEEQPILLEECYRHTEPIKIITRRVITNNGNNKMYKQLYYSTELRSKTAVTYYEEEFENVSVKGNVVTLVCE